MREWTYRQYGSTSEMPLAEWVAQNKAFLSEFTSFDCTRCGYVTWCDKRAPKQCGSSTCREG